MNAKTPNPSPALSAVDPDATDTPPDTRPKPGASTQAAAEAHARAAALLEERQRLAERKEALKNEKLRRQVADMEAEARNEARAQDQAAAETDASEDQAASQAASLAPPPVPRARPRGRHVTGLLSFLIMVVLPVTVSAWYLWARAHDRYVSYAGFSVRTEEIGSAFELLGGVAELSGSSSSDTDILYKFIQSPELVARVEAQLGLRDIWSWPGRDWGNPGHDPIFAYTPNGAQRGILRVFWPNSPVEDRPADAGTGDSIEALTSYWNHMVKVYSDSGTGLIDLEVMAFTPQEARAIAEVIYAESSAMINRLAASAREDATRYARDELAQAETRLTQAREALTRFRLRTGIVDPSVTLQENMGLLAPLQAQLAQALIDLRLQRQTTRAGDPRLIQLENRVTVIEEQIADERRKLGLDTQASADDEVFAINLAEFERLSVAQEFAQQSYTAALANFDAAMSEAQRQSRYLAAHVNPTLPESATRPERFEALALVALFAFLIWATLLLAVYALRDRR